MNTVHASVIRRVREWATASQSKSVSTLDQLDDLKLARLLFSNYRGQGATARGLRLTRYGFDLLRHCFRAYPIDLPEGYRATLPELLYLDRRATLPYHLTATHLYVFESQLGIMLKLADGRIATLIEMER